MKQPYSRTQPEKQAPVIVCGCFISHSAVKIQPFSPIFPSAESTVKAFCGLFLWNFKEKTSTVFYDTAPNNRGGTPFAAAPPLFHDNMRGPLRSGTALFWGKQKHHTAYFPNIFENGDSLSAASPPVESLGRGRGGVWGGGGEALLQKGSPPPPQSSFHPPTAPYN